MARTDFDVVETKEAVLLMPFSDKSTVAEIIEGVKSLENAKLAISVNPDLEREIRKLLVFRDKRINISNEKDILQFLDGIAIKDATIEEIVGEKSEKLESTLSQKQIEALVEEYEIADEKRRAEISQKLKNEPSAREKLQKAIKRQQEIAREKVVLEKLDLEKLNEKKEIDRIAKSEKITKEEAREILNQAKIIEAHEKVEQLAEQVSNRWQDPDTKSFIKVQVKEVIKGNISQLEGVAEQVGGINAKTVEIEIQKWKEEHKETVRQNELYEIEKEFDRLKVKAETTEELREIEKAKEITIKWRNVQSPDITTNKSRHEAQLKLEKDNGISIGQSNGLINKVQITLDSTYHKPEEFRRMMGEVRDLSDFGRKMLAGTKFGAGIEELAAKAVSNPVIANMQQLANTKIDFIDLVTKIPGVNTLLVGAGEIAGFKAAGDFIALSTAVMAEQGTIPGAVAIFQALTTGAGVLSGEAAVEGITTLSAMLGAFQGIPVLGQVAIVLAMIVVGGIWVYDHILKPLYDKLNEITSSLGINLWGVRDGLVDLFGDNWFGRGVGTLGQFAFNGATMAMAGMAMLLGPIMAIGLATMTAIITPVIIALIGGFMAYNLFFVSPMIASLVPPPPQATGGTCWAKTDSQTASGGANCDTNAPEANIGITKEQFASVADGWNNHTGKNYALECFNDVVNKAQCAGVNPKYALWGWLHESGASDYERYPNVSDFGVPGAGKGFTQQLEAFLKLDPASACLNKNGITDYWVAFSTNFLLGTDLKDPINNGCDPNKESSGTTGTKYAAELRKTWSDMGFGDLPNSIKGDVGGQCIKNEKRSPNEYVTKDGTEMVCDAPVNEDGSFVGGNGSSSYNENAGNVTGVKVVGECSVGRHVIDTKQCGQSWSQMALKGPVPEDRAKAGATLGTICSAGCGPTSASMILQSKNKTLTPNSVIFRDGSAYLHMFSDGSGLDQARSELSREGFGGLEHKVGCSEKDINGWVCAGKAVIILAFSETGNGGTTGHMLVAKGIQNGKIIVADPYFSNSTPFSTAGAGHIRTLRECLTVQVGKD